MDCSIGAFRQLSAGLAVLACLTGCAGVPLPSPPEVRLPSPAVLYGGPRSTAEFTPIPYSTFGADEAAYRIYPGDVLDINIPSAPELAKTVTVTPDGRISMPLIAPVMAADRTLPELRRQLGAAYSSQLIHPEVDIAVKQATPLKVFVGGEVDKPGAYDMPGDINALQAVLLAGGFRTSAQRANVLVIRRGPGGQPMMRTFNLKDAIYDPGNADAAPLRRFDIVYVPRSGIANVGLFVQQYLRDTLPIQFSYAINNKTFVSNR